MFAAKIVFPAYSAICVFDTINIVASTSSFLFSRPKCAVSMYNGFVETTERFSSFEAGDVTTNESNIDVGLLDFHTHRQNAS